MDFAARRTRATKGPRPAPATATIRSLPSGVSGVTEEIGRLYFFHSSMASATAFSYWSYLTGSPSKTSYVADSRLSESGWRGDWSQSWKLTSDGVSMAE